ncbi:Na+/H+ antiporter subunit E [Histidinibacterium lentulum]|uniref:Sodium:proton antiporter n=1 Tax=Histidinibacterium lentulum TaxID=2480588 RepID=A0A3N2R8R7_9RHOB|nr:Na+/H+ antiporter subunit E [Histidinibacterium lentulum]ROU03726.1 sodium:proton antiporter [Histidinibacterium lentulum]
MNFFALNLFLAVGWAFFAGGFTLTNLVVGFFLGYAALWLIAPLLGENARYPMRLIYWVKLAVLFLYELVVSSLEVAWDIITPGQGSRPAIIVMPLDVKSDAGILLIANLITLTPGTLSLDVSEDRKSLKIHAMFADDPEALIRSLKAGMEKWVKDAVE